MTDISVSRLHAQIKFQDNKFYIVDEKSKFGTLIKLDKKMDLSRELVIQAGRSTYTLSTCTESNRNWYSYKIVFIVVKVAGVHDIGRVLGQTVIRSIGYWLHILEVGFMDFLLSDCKLLSDFYWWFWSLGSKRTKGWVHSWLCFGFWSVFEGVAENRRFSVLDLVWQISLDFLSVEFVTF